MQKLNDDAFGNRVVNISCLVINFNFIPYNLTARSGTSALFQTQKNYDVLCKPLFAYHIRIFTSH